jgi:two-component system, cell cycle sensor histidine kinase and response regulator CckA
MHVTNFVSMRPSSPTEGSTGTEVILVVDDEASVRAPIARMLKHLGYFVLEASNGEDALEVISEYGGPVHLVISDVRMPEMDGAELAGMLRSAFPDMRLLLISGVGAHAIDISQQIEGCRFLAKPFTLEELALTVRSLLDE